MEFLVRPAMFWRFGTAAAQQVIDAQTTALRLEE
jgi:hypothetical protein